MNYLNMISEETIKNIKALDYSIINNKEEYEYMLENKNKNVHIILEYHGAGFWSIFNKIINYLLYYTNISKISYNVVPNIEFTLYGTSEIYNKVFDEYINSSEPELVIHAKNYITYEATGCFAPLLHLSDQSWRNKYNELWNKYIKIKSHVYDLVPTFNDTKKNISILIRHNALANEQINNRMPTFQQYDIVLQELLNTYNNNCRIILATDLYEAEQYFRKNYSHIEIFHPYSVKTSNNQDEPSRILASSNENNIEIAVATVLVLAKGDHFLYPNSNMATAALYINPTMIPHFLIG